MLSLLGLKTRCPVSLEERVWLERRMCWLRDGLGAKRLNSAVMQFPGDFPEIQTLDAQAIERLFDRLCNIMEIRQKVQLEFVPDDPLASDAGSYEVIEDVGVIRVRESTASDGVKLVAVLAHELAHAILLGENYLDGTEPDMEPLTDLATVFLGLGAFGANACLQESFQKNAVAYSWSMNRLGYLNSVQFGYALALFCWLRREQPGEWARKLRPDAAKTLSRALKFLKHSDSELLFVPRPTREDQFGFWEQRLQTNSPAVRLDALFDISSSAPHLPESFRALLAQQLHDHEVCIVSHALDVLTQQPHLVEPLEEDAVNCLTHESVRVREATIGVLEVMPITPPIAHAITSVFFTQREHSIRLRAAVLLQGQDDVQDADKIANELLVDVRTALLNHNDANIISLLSVIEELTQDAESILRERFGQDEHDEWFVHLMDCLQVAKSED